MSHVEDLQGNVLVNPQMMMVYVNRNVLKWKETELTADLDYGEGKVLVASCENISGRTVSYNIVENSSWLSVEQTQGTFSPLGYNTIKATVSSELAPGDYETTIYLVDENGLSEALPVKVTVTAQAPEWTVTQRRRIKISLDYSYPKRVTVLNRAAARLRTVILLEYE